MKLTEQQLKDLTNQCIKSARKVQGQTWVDYIGMFDGKLLVCTVTKTGDAFRVTCTSDGEDITEQVEEYFEVNLRSEI